MEKLKTIEKKGIDINYRKTILALKEAPIEHYHNAYEIALFLQADIELFIKDKKYSINNGDLIFIKEYEIHKIVYSGTRDYIRYVINFKKDYLKNILKLLKVEFLLPSNNIKIKTTIEQRNELEKLINEIKKIKSNRQDNEKIKEAKLKSFLIILLSKIKELIKKSPPIIISKKGEHVQNIILFIDKYYMNNINLDLLAKKLYLNKFYISHIFKEITGFSLTEYLQHKRIIIAQKMLTESNQEITDIAYECVFNNLQHFYRVFKKITKTTPYEYKKNNRIHS